MGPIEGSILGVLISIPPSQQSSLFFFLCFLLVNILFLTKHYSCNIQCGALYLTLQSFPTDLCGELLPVQNCLEGTWICPAVCISNSVRAQSSGLHLDLVLIPVLL